MVGAFYTMLGLCLVFLCVPAPIYPSPPSPSPGPTAAAVFSGITNLGVGGAGSCSLSVVRKDAHDAAAPALAPQLEQAPLTPGGDNASPFHTTA